MSQPTRLVLLSFFRAKFLFWRLPLETKNILLWTFFLEKVFCADVLCNHNNQPNSAYISVYRCWLVSFLSPSWFFFPFLSVFHTDSCLCLLFIPAPSFVFFFVSSLFPFVVCPVDFAWAHSLSITKTPADRKITYFSMRFFLSLSYSVRKRLLPRRMFRNCILDDTRPRENTTFRLGILANRKQW